MTDLPDIATQAGEATTLRQFLDYYRVVLLRKSEGLTDDQARISVAPSDLTLGKLLRHMTVVECNWASYVLNGDEQRSPWAEAPWDEDPDWEMTTAADFALAELQADLKAAWADADRIYDSMPSLDQQAARPRRDGIAPTVRWILVHMIEEYARHAGHADFIRQSIDGAVGD